MRSLAIQCSESNEIVIMQNTTPQTLAVETRHEFHEFVLDSAGVKPAKQTSIIYDDEIGLWEELESRGKRRFTTTGNRIDRAEVFVLNPKQGKP